VYNPRGTLLGKIFTGPPGSANFIWAQGGQYVFPLLVLTSPRN
jgi:hypothetical protein